MAERRMFAKTVVDNDTFLDMPASAQLLYFHLAMSADDDGFASKPKAVMRSCGSTEADMKLLVKNGLVIPFRSGVTAITHWKLHNVIRRDMYTETKYLAEKRQLGLNEIGAYVLKNAEAEPLQASGSNFDEPLQASGSNFDESLRQDRLGQDRIGQVRLEQDRPEEDKAAQASAAARTVVNRLNAAAGTRHCADAKQTVALVKGLLASGHTEAEMLQVIGIACEKWRGTEKESLLRPSFLFGEHFEELLGGDISAPPSKQKKTSAHSYDARDNTNYSHVYTDLSELANLEEV
ncbi:MAG: conserved phage C-terminal domain-containing protein [Clostridiales bacterium]|nr:conserved phage C-terminal domain-containing protein [Clostridiales bacterium]